MHFFDAEPFVSCRQFKSHVQMSNLLKSMIVLSLSHNGRCGELSRLKVSVALIPSLSFCHSAPSAQLCHSCSLANCVGNAQFPKEVESHMHNLWEIHHHVEFWCWGANSTFHCSVAEATAKKVVKRYNKQVTISNARFDWKNSRGSVVADSSFLPRADGFGSN